MAHLDGQADKALLVRVRILSTAMLIAVVVISNVAMLLSSRGHGRHLSMWAAQTALAAGAQFAVAYFGVWTVLSKRANGRQARWVRRFQAMLLAATVPIANAALLNLLWLHG